MNKVLQERLGEIEKLAKEMGVDWYDIVWEVVPQEVMLDVISYGLPTRARHWSYGQSYQYQKMQGEMGFSKIYEVILNNDPSYAFLLDTNPDVINTMIMAHCLGHSGFFKNNFLFKQTDSKMVYHAAERARRIDEYIQKYGIEAVEKIMDIGFALDKHIDWHKGPIRRPAKTSEVSTSIEFDEFDDLLGSKRRRKSNRDTLKRGVLKDPEMDILWFLINNSYALEPWQQDVLEIIRQESYYFYPQHMTKIANEGYASFWHAEIMLKLDCITEAEYLDFVKLHEKVVQPGSNKLNINPYFLGFSILTEIREIWDEKFKNGESDINGYQKIHEVIADEDDISFVRNWLSEDLAKKLKLFSYKNIRSSAGDEAIEITGTELDGIKEVLIKDLYNYRAPLIKIVGVEDGILQLEHASVDVGTLDTKHLEMVMGYVYQAWGDSVNIKTVDNDGRVIYFTYDELGFSE